MTASDFDLRALFDALDHERQARGLNWADVMRSLSGSDRPRPVATSTITSLRTKTVAEADGVLQMLRWLNRTPESFVRGAPAGLRSRELPAARAGIILRFDTPKLYDALDRQRKARGLTWTQVATEAGVYASHLRTLASGGRTSFPIVMRLTIWLQQPAADFVRKAAL